MQRRFAALASFGWGLLSVGLVACAGDDTNPPLPDAGVDATVDGSFADAATADAGTDAGSDDAACTPFDAGTFTDAEIQAGQKIVLARKCTQCHGEQLQGNQNGVPSTTAIGGLAYPPDLTPDPVNGLGCWSNAEIERAFLHGLDDQGQPLCNPMPHFGEMGDAGIDEAGAAAVLAYLRSIPVVVNPHVPSTPDCPLPPPFDAGPDAGEDAGDAGAVDAAGDASDAGDAGDAGSDGGSLDAAPDATVADAGEDAAVTDASDAQAEDAEAGENDSAADASGE